MEAQVRLRGGNLIIKLEGETHKDLFQSLCQIGEAFNEKCCGVCGSEDISPFWRTATVMKGKKSETYDYPEWRCNNSSCRAKLSLSFNLEGGTMFANRKLLPSGQPATGENRDKGSWGSHNGWTKYRGEPKQDGDSKSE